jgi:hypothetical protein
MAQKRLSLDSLMELDGGRAAMAFQHELEKIVQDLDDRPGDKSPRKVMIQLSIIPEITESGAAVTSEVAFRVKSSVPDRKTTSYRMKIDPVGKCLTFNPHAPDAPEQQTFDEVDVPKKRRSE